MAEPVPGIQAVPAETNARYFKVVVAGPHDVSSEYTKWTNGLWSVENGCAEGSLALKNPPNHQLSNLAYFQIKTILVQHYSLN